jgi:ferredoxin-NADP reductase
MTGTESVMLSLQVAEVRVLNSLVHCYRLRAEDGRVLPPYAPGAHIRVEVQLPGGEQDWRHYSLINLSTDTQALKAPTEYVIAVRREDEGRGGSRYMHGLQPGQVIRVASPKNEFPMSACNGQSVLLAGGIGVTPLMTMAASCVARQQAVRMVYAGRERTGMAFTEELQALLGPSLTLHVDAEAGGALDVDGLLDGCGAQDVLYVCGPQPMLNAVLEKTRARGWARDRVHFEVFNAPVQQSGDHAFELVLAASGKTLTVPADKSILDVLIDEGCDPLYDCQRGECGVCAVTFQEGEVDHRDYVLSDKEKQTGHVMHPCVSRCKGARLVLDL